jgi:predicted dehydrogenase
MSGPAILVIGAGSIGRRHATNLAALGAQVAITDVDPSRLVGAPWPIVRLRREIPHGFDGIVLATPTTLHAAQAREALGAARRVLVEKPLATTVADGRDLVERGGDRLMVGYNLRHHAPLERVAALLAEGRIGTPTAYRFWFGQWLPDWRPNVDYRDTYSARSELGGGVLFDAIHELDLAVWMAGESLRVVGATVARVGPLEIDVEDTVRALLVNERGVPVTIELDYLSRQYRRGVEVTGDLGTLSYDWATGAVEVREADCTVSEQFATPVDESYEREAAEFLGFVEGDVAPRTSAAVALRSLELAAAIRTCAGSARVAA